MTFRTPLRSLAAALGLACALTASPALACGGFFCMNQPIDQTGERIVFMQDAGEVAAHVRITYQGDAKLFSWVVPTPSVPTLAIGSDALFQKLEQATAPQFRLALKTLGDCPQPVYEMEDRASGSILQKSKNEVQVISQAQVGPYDSAVIRSNDPGALKAWLKRNGYTLPQKLDPLLDPYVAGKYYFVALKLQQDRGAGDLQPIVLRYKATKPGIPIRLTSVAATPDMDVVVWVLGDHRAIPENYRHAVINEAKIDWLGYGGNYKQVVSRAVDEAGGQAFVTDYAGDAKAVDVSGFRGEHMNLARLATLTDPVAFLRAIQDEGYFERGSANALAFVKRYVPIPKALGQVWEPGFYSNPEGYREQLSRLHVRVDARKAASELEETVVKPYREVLASFARHGYLTRLYTTMSPEEMTQDPLFRTSAWLPRVSNVHEASGVRDCRWTHDFQRAPVRITLKNGYTYTVHPDRNNRFYPDSDSGVRDLPYAATIEQLQADGGASTILDNRASIATRLMAQITETSAPSASSQTFGCAVHRVSDAGEGDGQKEAAVYGLLLLGCLALRRRKP